MGELSRVILYLVISNIGLWVAVICLGGIKIAEVYQSRKRIKAQVLDGSGAVRDEYILDKQKELLIGKSTPSNLVNIDFSDSAYAGTIEEEHASFRRYGRNWYVCANAGNGLVGLKQRGDDTVYKLRRDIPYRIGCGDIVYISYEKIVIQ